MKRIMPVILEATGILVLFFTLHFVLNKYLPKQEEPKRGTEIVFATDLHYLSPRINDGGEVFKLVMSNSDGKITPYCVDILDAFASEIIERKPAALVLGGDLTFNGEKASHEDLCRVLEKISEAGVPVLVIPGNHDMYNDKAFEFHGEEYCRAETISAEDFRELYSALGFDNAISTDENSLSYMYNVNDSLCILMLDTNSRGQNIFSKETLKWAEAELSAAKARGEMVIAVSHQNLYRHNEQLYMGYQLYGFRELVDMYIKYGVKCNLSGHIHMQHIMDEGIPEIVTSSLCVYPLQYGVITINDNVEYETKELDVSAWAVKIGKEGEEYANFSEYTREYFKIHSTDRLRKQLDELSVPDREKELLISTFGELNTVYFAGHTFEIDEFSEGIELWRNTDSARNKYVEIMAGEANTDHCSLIIE